LRPARTGEFETGLDNLQAAKYLSKARIAGKGGRGRFAAARQLWSFHYGWQNAGDLLPVVEIASFTPGLMHDAHWQGI